MTTVIRRPVAVLFALLAAVLVLSGCANQPNRAGAAAIVGDTVIPLESVQSRVRAMLADDSAARQVLQQRKLDVQGREILTLQVLHQVMANVARKEGLSVSQQQVQRLLDQVGGSAHAAKNSKDPLGISVYDERSIRERVHDELLFAELAKKHLPTLSVTFDYVVSSSRGEAESYAKQLAADPGKARQIISGGGTAPAPGELNRTVSAAQAISDAANTPLFGLSPGSVATFPAGQQGTQWLTVLVRQRNPNAQTDEAARRAVTEAQPQMLSQAGLQLLIPYAQRMGIEISPRYGTWDPIGLQVVAEQNQALGTLRTAKPAGQ